VNCQDSQEFLHAYLDGELDLVRHLEVERHLAECPTCARDCERQQALRAALRAGGLRPAAPEGLRRRVRAALRQAEPASPRSWHASTPAPSRRTWPGT
jgi:mycothiol system anti-sigma-R factor